MKRREFLKAAGVGIATSTIAAPAIAQSMPELKWRAGYPLAVGVTLLGCVFVYRRLRRAGWV